MQTPIPVVLLTLLLAGCGADEDNPASRPAGETAAVQASGTDKPDTVFDTQIDAMDKARQIENTLLEAAEAERQQIEQATE